MWKVTFWVCSHHPLCPPPPQLEGEFWEGCLLFSSVLFQDVSARPRCQGWGWQGGVPYTPTKDYFSQSQQGQETEEAVQATPEM